LAGVRLSAVIAGRDNNLNLMRFLAAALVMVNHAFGITGHTATEPFYRVFELGGGDIGVDVFFVLSGFLVTRSWEGKPLPAFLWARCMRIYPGLWVSVLVTVILAGACFATVPRLEFWSSRSTLTYVGHNLLMLPHLGARLDLPHAFTAAGSEFNVSLWTLPLEIQMYLTLALLGVLLGIRARYLAALTLLGVGIVLVSKLTHSSHDMLLARGRFLYFFFAGSLAYALRGRIILRSRTAATLLALVFATIAVTGVFAVRQGADSDRGLDAWARDDSSAELRNLAGDCAHLRRGLVAPARAARAAPPRARVAGARAHPGAAARSPALAQVSL